MQGLPNLGATCFCNALLQALHATHGPLGQQTDDIAQAYASAVSSQRPHDFVRAFRGAARQHGFASLAIPGSQDSHELFLLWTSMLPSLAAPFKLPLAEQLTCTLCNHVRTRDISNYCLELPAGASGNLADATVAFMADKPLPGGTCDACKASQCLRGRTAFSAPLGPYLTFHLAWQEKNGLAFPVTLIVNTKRYALSAVVCHPPGHYFAFVRADGKWYLCDDSRVQPCSVDDLLRYAGLASQLFYTSSHLN